MAAGSQVLDSWSLADFTDDTYHLRVHGPNGFYREFRGTAQNPRLETRIQSAPRRKDAALSIAASSPSSKIEVKLTNCGSVTCDVEIATQSYGETVHQRCVGPAKSITLLIDAEHSFGWYDFTLRVIGDAKFEHNFAGRIETGEWSFSDPLIGRHPT